jgi:hypothetical protein
MPEPDAIKNKKCTFCMRIDSKEESNYINLKLYNISGYSCPSCFKIRFGRCENCGKELYLGDCYWVAEGTGRTCRECGYYNCSICNKPHAKKTKHLILDRDLKVCKECITPGTLEACFVCEKENMLKNSGGSFYVSAKRESARICSKCVPKAVRSCRLCGCSWHKDLITKCSRCEDDMCICCEPGHICLTHQERAEVKINNAGYKPSPKFLPKGSLLPSKDRLFFGIELETDNFKFDRVRVSKSLYDIDRSWDRFYLKSDGSLNCGIEIVTYPATLKYHREEFPWDQISEVCKRFGGSSHDNSTCGLHIHTSVKAFGSTLAEQESNQAKLLLIFEKYWGKLVTISRRGANKMSYCNKVVTEKLPISEKVKAQKGSGRYYAVNLSPHDTVEFRLFKGTLFVPTIIASIELVNNITLASVNLTAEQITKLNWTDFIPVLLEQEKVSYLPKYLNSRGVAKLTIDID